MTVKLGKLRGDTNAYTKLPAHAYTRALKRSLQLKHLRMTTPFMEDGRPQSLTDYVMRRKFGRLYHTVSHTASHMVRTTSNGHQDMFRALFNFPQIRFINMDLRVPPHIKYTAAVQGAEPSRILKGINDAIHLHQHEDVQKKLQGIGYDDNEIIVADFVPEQMNKEWFDARGGAAGENALRLCAQLLLVVRTFHAVGITCTDLKEDNVLISADGNLRMIDYLDFCDRYTPEYYAYLKPLLGWRYNSYHTYGRILSYTEKDCYYQDIWRVGIIMVRILSWICGRSETDNALHRLAKLQQLAYNQPKSPADSGGGKKSGNDTGSSSVPSSVPPSVPPSVPYSTAVVMRRSLPEVHGIVQGIVADVCQRVNEDVGSAYTHSVRCLAQLCTDMLDVDLVGSASTTQYLMDPAFEPYIDHARCDWDRDIVAIRPDALFQMTLA